MRLYPLANAEARARALHGGLDGLRAAPGWPHEDTAAGLSFLDHGGLVFLVLDDDDRICGECGTKAPPDLRACVEIGYGLAAPSRGRGLGRAAVAELVDWLAGLLHVRRVEAEVHVGNEPSLRLLRGLGFIETGPVTGGYRRFARSVGTDP